MIDNIIQILIANGAVLIVPGLNFYLISNTSMHKGIRFGLTAAFGITLGIMLHVCFAMIGAYKIFHTYPLIFKLIKVVGVCYIIWLAYKVLKISFNNHFVLKKEKQIINSNVNNECATGDSLQTIFLNGFCIDLLNPYITIFYLSLLSQIISEDASTFTLLIYVGIIFLITIMWFSLIAILFSRTIMKEFFLRHQNLIGAISAVFLIYFAFKLYFS